MEELYNFFVNLLDPETSQDKASPKKPVGDFHPAYKVEFFGVSKLGLKPTEVLDNIRESEKTEAPVVVNVKVGSNTKVQIRPAYAQAVVTHKGKVTQIHTFEEPNNTLDVYDGPTKEMFGILPMVRIRRKS